MSDTAIKVEGLSKRYRIGAQQRAYRTLREKLNESVMAPFRVMKSLTNGNGNGNGHKSKSETFWALKDVSFEVKAGEAVGIIGRNGAGKSTLLKILSRITEPTRGYADINGRIASLLEVGTGFHPELSGRENIFLNGSILGMKRVEIRKKFDEMVAFAEIDKFIDTPVKHYSSGMYVRLAFAVAAHLDPEILLVDEVLAVGDAEFQKKCLGKMGDVAREGRTVLFVSHNLGAINRLCASAIWINDGEVEMAGDSEHVVGRYLSSGAELSGERRWSNPVEAPGTPEIRLLAVRISNRDREQSAIFDVRRPINIEIEYELLAPLPRFRTAFRLVAGDGTVILTSAESSNTSWDQTARAPGKYTSWCEIPGDFLNVGQYGITVSCDVPMVRTLFFVENCLNFHVEETGSHSGRFPERWPGVICPKFDWQLERMDRQSVTCGALSD